MKIVCPNCHYQEYVGALYCSQCGTSLSHEEGVSTQELGEITGSSASVDRGGAQISPGEFSKGTELTLVLLDTGQFLKLRGKKEFTLGRLSKEQSVLPDVDLSLFNAYQLGVSRLHAAIDLRQGQPRIMDLGSANGTRVNRNKLVPQKPFPLKHGDVITLGKLKMRVILQ